MPLDLAALHERDTEAWVGLLQRKEGRGLHAANRNAL
jgi:hypothetical protein